MVVKHLHFQTADDFLAAVFDALQKPGQLKLVASRAITSSVLREKLTPDDIALLLLMSWPRDSWPPAWTTDIRNTGKEKEKNSSRPTDEEVNDKQSQGKHSIQEISDVLNHHIERQESFSRLAASTFPHMNLVAQAEGWQRILLYADDIETVYGSDNPFTQINEFISGYFYDPYQENKGGTSITKEGCQIIHSLTRSLLSEWHGPELGAFRNMANIYIGDAHLEDLLKNDVANLMPALLQPSCLLWRDADPKGWQYRDTYDEPRKSASPILEVILQLAYSYMADAGNAGDELHEALLEGLLPVIKELAADHAPLVTDIDEYIRRRSTELVAFAPRWSDILLERFHCYGKNHEDDIFVELLEATFDFMESGNAPKTILSIDFFAGFTLEDIGNYPEKTGFFVSLAKMLDEQNDFKVETKNAWDLVFKRIVSYLLNRNQFSLCDAFLSAWIFTRIYVLKTPAPEPTALAGFIQRIPASERYFIDQTTSLLRQCTKYDEIKRASAALLARIPPQIAVHVHAMARLPFSHTPPNEQEIESKFEEILSKRGWECLSERAKNDLLKAELEWERMRADASNPARKVLPERAFFNHLACALEAEIKETIAPIINHLNTYFAANKVSSDDKLYRLQSTVQRDHSLGNLLNLVTQRKNPDKLKNFPECVTALERSDFILRIINDPEKRRWLEIISAEYRNPASHDNKRVLGIKEAAELRDILFKQSLLRDLVLARINNPVRITVH